MATTTVLAAVNGDESDAEVIKLACELVKKPKGELFILYVIEVERSLPIDAEISHETGKAEEVLSKMETMAKSLKCKYKAELLQSRQVGYAVVQEAVQKGVDVIVLGTSRQTRYGKFDLGSTVPFVLKHAPCEVVLWRGSATNGVPSGGQLNSGAR